MKKIFLIVFALILYSQTQAQVWDWNEDSLSWRISTHMNFSAMQTRLYTTSGNETINDTIYRVVHPLNCFAPPGSSSQFTFLIRQEGDSILFRYDDQEYLMYDFGLEVGDSFDRYLCFTEGGVYPGTNQNQPLATATVTAIDTIEIDGEPRKRFFLEDYLWDTWIEGIGSIYSFARMDYCKTDVVDNLECFHRNGVQEYIGFHDECCPNNLSTQFSDFIASNNILFPNPISRSQAFKRSSQADHAVLSFYDSKGRLFKSVKWKDGMSPEKIGLESGYYTVLVQSEEGYFRQKLVVQ